MIVRAAVLMGSVRFALVATAALFGAAPAQSLPEPPPLDQPLGLDVYLRVPDDNALTPEKVALGRRLFFDPLLSADRSIACATCHDPTRAFTDGKALSVGVFGRRGSRSVPTLVNRAYGRSFFWDGRTTTLEEQVLRPIEARNEMDMRVPEVVERLRGVAEYTRLFESAFGRPPSEPDMARALASYVRTVLSGNAAVDRYVAGDKNALTEIQRSGRRLFTGKANCWHCHNGPILSDERFHNTGVAWRAGTPSDTGRYRVTGQEEHLGAFKVPTLREVARTAPYMHDGSIPTLEAVIDFYDRGGFANPYLDPTLRPLRLSFDEKRALVAFLRSLSGTVQEGY